MTVRLVGEGPAIDAAAAALEDADVAVGSGDTADLSGATLGIVCDVAGADTFAAANDAADRWIGIEVGGVGSVPLEGVDAAVSGFGPDAGCYRCLQQRVAANGPEPAEGPSGDGAAVRLAGAIAGREAVRVLAGDDRIQGRVIEVPHTDRDLLPVPGCECERTGADGRPPSRDLPIPREHAERGIEETVARMDRSIDDRLGIVTQLGEAESFPAPYYLATLANTTGFSDGDAPDQAAGVADGWNPALAKAVGEALERYAAAIYRADDVPRAPPGAVENAVPPAAFAGAGDDAPGRDDDAPVRWVEAEPLGASGTDGSEQRVWLPASAVYFPPPAEGHLTAITTGLGLGSSPVDALLSGLTEVIERDATMLSWYSTFEPLGLAVDDPDFDRLARRARSEDLTVTPLLVTQDVDVPVVTVAVHREDPWPRFAVGSAAALDPVDAGHSALAEALQNWMELRSVGEADASDLQGAIGRFASLPRAARDLVDVEATVPADSVGPEEPPEGTAALDALLAALADADVAPIEVNGATESAAASDRPVAAAARLTTRDLADLGFEAVRVVVPGAQPLFTGTPRFGERAESVPVALGFESRLEREHHPYP